MKAGWKLATLGDVCDLINRGISPKYLEKGGVCVLNQKCIRDHVINYDLARRHDVTVKKVNEERFIHVGDVLVNSTGTGTLGRVAQIRQEPKDPTTVDSHVTIVRPKSNIFFQDFFGYMLIFIEDSIKAAGEGCGGQTELAKSVLANNFTVAYPTSLVEQQRIVTILDEAFEAIAAARANAEHNRQNARALFESYLQSVFSQRGEGWKKVPLGGLCDFLNGYAFKSDDATSDSNTQLVRMGNLYGNKLDLDRNPVFYPDNYAADYKRFILSPGDLVMSLTGTTGKEDYGFAVQIPEADRVLLLNQRIAKFDSIKEDLVCREYLLHYLRSRVFLDLLYPTANGTRQANLSTVTMKTLPVWLCSIPEQKTIVASLDAMQIDTQRLESLYQRKIAALDELKQSLLQQAFSGQLDTTRVEVLTP
ncbi:restriction endonuclease subunit S [Aeromonas rivipollensis]|uniref:restriction endonuclease subunit S n=1 Tax=Aeromonas rivipollensis TaxID=948519 RepID=UPI003D1CDE1C